MRLNLKLTHTPLTWSAYSSRAAAGLTWMARAVLLTHHRATERMLMALCVVVGGWLVVVLLYLPPPGEAMVEEMSVHLDKAALGNVESWIDARAQARAAGLRVPADRLQP